MRPLSAFLDTFPLSDEELAAFCADPLDYLEKTDTSTEGLPDRVGPLPEHAVKDIKLVRDLKALCEKYRLPDQEPEGGKSPAPPKAETAAAAPQIQLRAAPAILHMSAAEPLESFAESQVAESAAAPKATGLPFPEFRAAFEQREKAIRTPRPQAEIGLLEAPSGSAPPKPSLDTMPDAGLAGGTQLLQIIGVPGQTTDGPVPEAVILADNRVQVTDTEADPFRWLCRLEITAGTGARWLGTGWFISPGVIVTAGHCVFIHNHGGWVRSIAVHVAQNGAQTARSFVATNYATTRGWAENRDTAHDYGVVFAPPDDQGYFGYGVLSDGVLNRALANVSGYPQDKPPGTLWGHVKQLRPPQPTILHYEIDTFGGMSGAPVVLWDGRDYVAVGIHNYGDAAGNTATRITAEVFYNFTRWKSIGAGG